MFKSVMRYDPNARLLRVCRWGGNVFDSARSKFDSGFFYSWKFSIGLRPSLFNWRRELDGWLLTVFGIRLHYCRSYGGMYAG